ncbi:MAG: hypothetical protein Q9170_004699 [Blastenia crenularia]
MALYPRATSYDLPTEPFLVRKALGNIAADTVRRSGLVCRRLGSSLGLLLIGTHGVAASPINSQPADNSTSSNSSTPADILMYTPEAKYLTGNFNWKSWNRRADDIRHNVGRAQCMLNLNSVLKAMEPLEMNGTSGSSGALTLLPTAGALIGAPTKELWVVYKLMPIAGVLSMMLSLGGNIVPTEASDYKMKAPRFTYGGLVATRSREDDTEEPEDLLGTDECDSQVFADMVARRAKDPRGGQRFARVWYGIILQIFWIGVVMTACWYAGSGSILIWWCKGWGWMWLWYLTVAGSSILENYAGVPFTHQWTLRVSRAPRVRISEDAPLLRQPQTTTPVFRQIEDDIAERSPSKLKNAPTVQIFEEVPLVRRTTSGRSTETLDALEAGLNCKGQIIRDGNEPWSSSRVPFYVVISLEGISGSHAALRVFSKAFAIGVFVTGTAIFASTQLIAMSVAVTVLCLVLGAGVFERVIAMWMASEMMKTKPVLHRVVKSRGLAAEYIDRILAIDGLVVEVMGHVIVSGRCIQRYNPWFRLSNWLGLLAGPYNIGKLTMVN